MGSIRAVCKLCGHSGYAVTGIWKKSLNIAPAQHLMRNPGGLNISAQVRYENTKADSDVNKLSNEELGKLIHPDKLEHFKKSKPTADVSQTDVPPIGTHALPHPIWSEEELHNVKITHKPPEGIVDKMAFYSVKIMRKSFDLFTLFNFGERTEKKWILRICFLETVAGVPGMVAAMTRHLHSLRRLQRDYGWIHTLLEEAENERMHLMTALQLRQPTWLFRMSVLAAQGVFVNLFALSYLISPRFCHRFVGYLEEEAVYTYTKCLQDIESGSMKHWKTTPAPEVAITYWKLPMDSTMQDVIEAIRADEAHHRVVNHTLASMKPTEYNPFGPGE